MIKKEGTSYKSQVTSLVSVIWYLVTPFLLFTAYCLLLTALPGCGKKAPPKPPVESVSK